MPPALLQLLSQHAEQLRSARAVAGAGQSQRHRIGPGFAGRVGGVMAPGSMGPGGAALMQAVAEHRQQQREAAGVQHPHTLPLHYPA